MGEKNAYAPVCTASFSCHWCVASCLAGFSPILVQLEVLSYTHFGVERSTCYFSESFNDPKSFVTVSSYLQTGVMLLSPFRRRLEPAVLDLSSGRRYSNNTDDVKMTKQIILNTGQWICCLFSLILSIDVHVFLLIHDCHTYTLSFR